MAGRHAVLDLPRRDTAVPGRNATVAGRHAGRTHPGAPAPFGHEDHRVAHPCYFEHGDAGDPLRELQPRELADLQVRELRLVAMGRPVGPGGSVIRARITVDAGEERVVADAELAEHLRPARAAGAQVHDRIDGTPGLTRDEQDHGQIGIERADPGQHGVEDGAGQAGVADGQVEEELVVVRDARRVVEIGIDVLGACREGHRRDGQDHGGPDRPDGVDAHVHSCRAEAG